MAHAVSVSSSRSDHMSPWALALAILLHGLVLAALWWLSQNRPQPPAEQAIEVSFEQPKPPEPPPAPPEKMPEKAPQPPQAMPPIEGLRPPAPITADKPTQAPPKGDKPKDAALAPPPPPLQDSLPVPDPQPPAPTAAELAKPQAVAPAPQQQALASPPAPTGELPKPPPPSPAPPERHALATPPPAKPRPPSPPTPQLRRPEHAPSPLTTAPPRRPPAGTQSDNPSPSPFVNPADVYSRARVADNYLWQVVRKLQGYRYQARVNAREGLTVVRVVIARDGRLLNVDVARSSGYPEFDRGVLAGVRAGSPYAPLPPEIRGDSATFDLPLVSINRQ